MEPHNPPSSDVLARMEAAVTEEFTSRLGAYALSVVAQRSWRGIKGGVMPCGEEAMDLVQEGYRLVLAGKRKWNAEQDPDFLKYMMDVIDSLVSHRTKWVENQMERRIEPPGGEAEADFLDRKKDLRLADDTFRPPSSEDEPANEAWFFALVEETKGDPLITKVLDCFLSGVSKRSEIAERTGASVEEVTNAHKRLDRMLPKFREKYAHLNPKNPS